MSAHPQKLQIALERRVSDAGLGIARTMLEGFNKHYRIFRECSQAAKNYFENGDWLAVQAASRERIDFYDRRVEETVDQLQREFKASSLDDQMWQQAKLHYIGLLADHKQPECAETFFQLCLLQNPTPFLLP